MEDVTSIRKLRTICQPQHITRRVEEKWYGSFLRLISIWPTWLILHFRLITPNMITVLNLIIAIGSGGLLFINGLAGPILLFLAVFLFELIDRVDGEMARYKKTTSISGVYIDVLAHSFVYLSIFISLGLKLYFQYQYIPFLICGIGSALLINFASSVNFLMYSILYKKEITALEIERFQKKGFILNLYRFLIGPLEISFLIMLIGIIMSWFQTQHSFMIWLAFVYLYFIIFILSLLANIIINYKELNNIQKDWQSHKPT